MSIEEQYQLFQHFGIIYKATCIVNDKGYIGQTISTLEDRMYRHKNNDKDSEKRFRSAFHSAIRYHGFENFKWEIICICHSREELNEKETYYIEFYDTFASNGHGYNLTKGGGGLSGFKKSEESKKKTADKNRGLKRSEESKEKIRIKATGRKLSNETKEKIRHSRLGKKASLETRQKMHNKILTNDHKNNISKGNVGKHSISKYPIEIKEKCIELRKNGLLCREIGELMIIPENTIRTWCKDIPNMKRGSNMKGRIISAETRKNMSIAAKKRVTLPESRVKGWITRKKNIELEKN